MTGFIIKLIVCPAVVVISDWLSDNINYGSIYQALIIGLLLAGAGHMMEVLFLKRNTIWVSNILDFIASFALVYFSQYFLTNTYITLIGALFLAAFLTITEYLQHFYLVRTNKVEKQE